jgi:uncharacterized protein YbjQ (UPF0145 family)
MLFFGNIQDRKNRKPEIQKTENHDRVKDLFLNGKLPVVTTDLVEGKNISKVLGLVCCRGYDSEEAFFGMAARAVNKGAHAIVGYCENVAFHPDGSKYFSCFGTAVMFEWEPEEKYGAAALRESSYVFRAGSSELPARAPHAQHSGASEPEERLSPMPPREASGLPQERPPRLAQRNGNSATERPSRQGLRFDDEPDLPPLRPVGAAPSWQT